MIDWSSHSSLMASELLGVNELSDGSAARCVIYAWLICLFIESLKEQPKTFFWTGGATAVLISLPLYLSIHPFVKMIDSIARYIQSFLLFVNIS